MRFGLRIPSLAKQIAARTSVGRFIRHNLGVKAPRGMGWVTDPKKALYNRIYNRTTRGCMIYIVLLISCLMILLSNCDLKPKRERNGKATYVRPSVGENLSEVIGSKKFATNVRPKDFNMNLGEKTSKFGFFPMVIALKSIIFDL